MSDPKLKAARLEIEQILKKRDVTGVILLASEESTEFCYGLEASWTCIRFETQSDGHMGVRFRAKEAEVGKEKRNKLIKDSVSTVVGYQFLGKRLVDDMTKLLDMLRKHVEFTPGMGPFEPDEPRTN